MSDTNQRKAWIDVLKGITIFFVVLGHNPFLSNLPTKVFNVIFSFHIPLFFVISGYLFNSNVSCKDLFDKRFKSLLKPYIFTCIAISLLYIMIKNKPSPLWYLFWVIYGNGPNLPKTLFHLWFLPNLFLVTIFAWLLFENIKLLKNSIVAQIFLIAFFLIVGVLGIQIFWDLKVPLFITNFLINDGSLVFKNGLLPNPAYPEEALIKNIPFTLYGLPWSIDFVLVSAAFFLSGHMIKSNALEKYFHKGKIAIILMLLFITFHYFFNYTIDLNMRRYDNLAICTLLACASIYLCIYASYSLSKINNRALKVINYIGNYSLIIFIFHPIIQSKTYFTIAALLPEKAKAVAFLSALLSGVCVPLLLNWLLLERFKFFRNWYYA